MTIFTELCRGNHASLTLSKASIFEVQLHPDSS